MTNPTPSDSTPAGASSPGALLLRLGLLAALIWSGPFITGLSLPSLSPQEARRILDNLAEHRHAGNDIQALRAAQRLLASSPERPEYLAAEAELLTRLKDPKGAAAAWEAYVGVAPFPADACPQLPKAYDALGLDERALAAYRRCLAFDPGKADLMIYLGNALAVRGETAEAEALFQKVLAGWPRYTDARIGILRLRVGQNRLAEAERMLPEILKAAPNNPDAYFAAYLLARDKGERERAKAYLRRGLQASSGYVDLYRHLGRMYVQDKENEKAAELYKALLTVVPEDPQALAALRALGAAP